jgi:hypothetical protein
MVCDGVCVSRQHLNRTCCACRGGLARHVDVLDHTMIPMLMTCMIDRHDHDDEYRRSSPPGDAGFRVDVSHVRFRGFGRLFLRPLSTMGRVCSPRRLVWALVVLCAVTALSRWLQHPYAELVAPVWPQPGQDLAAAQLPRLTGVHTDAARGEELEATRRLPALALMGASDNSSLMLDVYWRLPRPHSPGAHDVAGGDAPAIELAFLHPCVLARSWVHFASGRPALRRQRQAEHLLPFAGFAGIDPDVLDPHMKVVAQSDGDTLANDERLDALLLSHGLPYARRLTIRHSAASFPERHAPIVPDQPQASGLRCHFAIARAEQHFGETEDERSDLSTGYVRTSWPPTDPRWSQVLAPLADTVPIEGVADPAFFKCYTYNPRGSYQLESVICPVPEAALAAHQQPGQRVVVALFDDVHHTAVGPMLLPRTRVPVVPKTIVDKSAGRVRVGICAAPLFMGDPVDNMVTGRRERLDNAPRRSLLWLLYDWLAYHLHLGVEQIVLYNLSLFPDASRARLRENRWFGPMIESGKLVLVDWPLGEQIDLHVGHTHKRRGIKSVTILQDAALVHCMRRFGDASHIDYVANIDVDEFVGLVSDMHQDFSSALYAHVAAPSSSKSHTDLRLWPAELHMQWQLFQDCNYSAVAHPVGEHVVSRCRKSVDEKHGCASRGDTHLPVCGKAMCSTMARDVMYTHGCLPNLAKQRKTVPATLARLEHLRHQPRKASTPLYAAMQEESGHAIRLQHLPNLSEQDRLVFPE